MKMKMIIGWIVFGISTLIIAYFSYRIFNVEVETVKWEVKLRTIKKEQLSEIEEMPTCLANYFGLSVGMIGWVVSGFFAM